MQVSKAVKTKYAVRDFKSEPVSDEVVLNILNAGRRSQSSKNRQPWDFVMVRNKETLAALSKTGDFAGHLAGADFAVCIVGDGAVTPGREGWLGFDFGQAAAYMQLAAWEQGVGSCIASIYHPDQAAEILKLPAGKSCWVALSFGYPAEHSKPAKMGGRKPMDEIVHWEQW
jgi:nitroreductase